MRLEGSGEWPEAWDPAQVDAGQGRERTAGRALSGRLASIAPYTPRAVRARTVIGLESTLQRYMIQPDGDALAEWSVEIY